MSIKEIEKIERDFLIPSEVCKVMGCTQYSVNVMAKAGKLPFRYFMVGNRVRIVKQSFLDYFKGV